MITIVLGELSRVVRIYFSSEIMLAGVKLAHENIYGLIRTRIKWKYPSAVRAPKLTNKNSLIVYIIIALC